MDESKTYQFYDAESGEDFFVEAKNKGEATKRAKIYFAKPKFIDEVTWEEADILGYDTYQEER